MKWRPIVDDRGEPIEGYEISDTGQVRSYWTFGPDSKVGWRARDMKLLVDKRGCWSVNLRVDRDRRVRFQVHRLVALTFLGLPPAEHHLVIHRNHNNRDNRVSNLRWAAGEVAFAHSAKVVDRYTGAQGGAPKLTKAAIDEILDSDLPQKDLAAKHKVNVRTIYSLRSRRSWARPDLRKATGETCTPAEAAPPLGAPGKSG